MASPVIPRIAVVICSQRSPRVGPKIADFVLGVLEASRQNQQQQQQQQQYQKQERSATSSSSSSSSYSVTNAVTAPAATATTAYSLVRLDLQDWHLPLFDEPSIPSHVRSADSYVQPHTRAWSAEVSSYAAFVFVCPQYNWGYPASVKNAIDYLYHEWGGKPAMIVSYGGKRGGDKAAQQLRQVLLGVRMKVAETMPGLPLKTEDILTAAALKGNLAPEAAKMWSAEGDLILKAFQELLELL
ncbi:MAG: hypothetical protein M1819_002594 [Sarea resinae]|nr:MAG: hypothetical protein M1819_002594 [Sarea resinae]